MTTRPSPGFAIAQHGALPDVGTRIEVELPPDPADLANDDEPPDSTRDVEVQDDRQSRAVAADPDHRRAARADEIGRVERGAHR